MRYRRTITATAVIAAVLLATGAESGGCGAKDDGKGLAPPKVEGAPRGTLCTFYTTGVRVERKQLIGTVTSVCRKSPLVHKVTVIMDRKSTNGGWKAVAEQNFDKAPAANKTKTMNLKVPCRAGVYRLRHTETVQGLDDKTPQFAKITDQREMVVTARDCE
ncbi:hypothetical protein GCM10010329_84860 [Streptomyces spiroverticillatus]|uniref:Secreted protein n=1 Tax=Streptomyces finlayi TaxID=67296 RepID=A0A918X9I1_9ACTN|nr:hypothetical protein [Streptomyces finlayi]GHA49731.1 hypothetical protein GCM10010329_84860 [Streptomyces spiroverticillatus]GHD19670.1 hypothetical protein GCM10010334_83570 [Streptomyces finlayi]